MPSILPAGTLTFLVVDGAVSVFETAADAVVAAAGSAGAGRRVALHTGDAHLSGDGRYSGPALRRCGWLAEIANPGQTLLSERIAAEVAGLLPDGWSVRDLGIHRLRDLSSPARVFELYQGVTGDQPRSLDTVPNNLPVRLTTFVGRDEELAAVHRLLAGERLVTITGAGGCGKTRLAAMVAAVAAERWPGGVWWVELAAVFDPAQVAELIAATIGVLVEPVAGPVRSLTLQLRDRKTLVCLDNCEQVLDGAAEVVDALLRSCPEVAVLTTSREPLGVAGETVWRVPSLRADEALALFVERASQVRPWFTVDASSEAAVRTICVRLDGIPLAIELAAAWLGTLTPQQIEAGLDNRFGLLTRGPRGAAERQRTLAASIAWSHDLLEKRDREVFRRLAVFPASFTLDAARAVVGGDDVLERLGRLVDKSLVTADGAARYRLLETIREYAADWLWEAGELAATRDRHLDHFLAFAKAAESQARRDKDSWRILLEAEHDNLRAALDWGLSGEDAGRGRRLAAELPWLWHLHGHGHEGMDFLGRAIECDPEDRSLLQGRLLVGFALIADTASPLDIEFDVAQRALEIATEHGDERLRALCLNLSAVGQFYTDFDAAWRLAEEAGRCAELSGDATVRHGVQCLQGVMLSLRDRHDQARVLLREAVEGLLAHGDRGIAATAVACQAGCELYTGDLRLARSLAEQAVDIADPLGDYHRVGTTRGFLALVHGFGGDVEAGLRVVAPILRLVDGAEKEVFLPGLGLVLGTLRLWRGDLDDAVQWLEREAWLTERGVETFIAGHYRPVLGAALRRLGRTEEAGRVLNRAVALATRLDMPRVLADALEQRAHLTGDLDLHYESLAIRVNHGLRTYWVDSLDAIASHLAAARPADAVRVLGAVHTAREVIGYPRPPVDQPWYDELIGTLREQLGDPFGPLWTDGGELSLEEVVAFVRRTRGSRGRPSSGWPSLTPTELDVVRLVVDGLNNPDIGARLFMSRATVKTHLSHIYAKLAIANRTELAAFATSRLSP